MFVMSSDRVVALITRCTFAAADEVTASNLDKRERSEGLDPGVSMSTRLQSSRLATRSFSVETSAHAYVGMPSSSPNRANCSCPPMRVVSVEISATFLFIRIAAWPAILAIVVVFPTPVGPTKALTTLVFAQSSTGAAIINRSASNRRTWERCSDGAGLPRDAVAIKSSAKS